tara:strand:+ start:487 stop:615 length:129 start_codon:yes stop_codon:yes gene_type:complete
MGVPKRLTEMQQKFANELVSNEGRSMLTSALLMQDTSQIEPE